MENHRIHPAEVISEIVITPRNRINSSLENQIIGMGSAGRHPGAAYKCSPKVDSLFPDSLSYIVCSRGRDNCLPSTDGSYKSRCTIEATIHQARCIDMDLVASPYLLDSTPCLAPIP